MLTAYLIVGGILAVVGICITFMSFCYSMEDDDVELRRVSAMVFSGTVLLVPLWPAWLGFALLAAFVYGLWTFARVIKHRSLDFDSKVDA